MHHLIALAIALFGLFCGSVRAGGWPSEIDEKYSGVNAQLLEQTIQARELLDNYSGRREIAAQARVVLDAVLAADPQFVPAMLESVRHLIKTEHHGGGRFDDGVLETAREQMDACLALEPNYAEGLSLSGNIYRLEGKLELAEASYRAAEATGSVDPWIELGWGDLLVEQKQFESALQRYLKVVNSPPWDQNSYSYALHNVGKTLQALGRFDEAEPYYHDLVAFRPDAWNWYYLAWFQLYRRGDADAAIHSTEQAIRLLDFGYARQTQSAAYITKWHQMLQAGASEADAQPYLDQGLAAYPDTNTIWNLLLKQEQTKAAALRLDAYYDAKQAVQPAYTPVVPSKKGG